MDESLLRAWCAWRSLVLLPVPGPLGPRGWTVRQAGGGGWIVGSDDLGSLAAMLGVGIGH